MTAKELARKAGVTRRHYYLGCHYMIGEPGRLAMVAMYQRLEAAYAEKPTKTIKREMVNYESFYAIIDYRVECSHILSALAQHRADSRTETEWQCFDSILQAARASFAPR